MYSFAIQSVACVRRNIVTLLAATYLLYKGGRQFGSYEAVLGFDFPILPFQPFISLEEIKLFSVSNVIRTFVGYGSTGTLNNYAIYISFLTNFL